MSNMILDFFLQSNISCGVLLQLMNFTAICISSTLPLIHINCIFLMSVNINTFLKNLHKVCHVLKLLLSKLLYICFKCIQKVIYDPQVTFAMTV